MVVLVVTLLLLLAPGACRLHRHQRGTRKRFAVSR
jgi:hypothetical protein